MMRSVGKGPKFIKRGRIFYFKEDLDSWLNEPGKLISTTQALHVNPSSASRQEDNHHAHS